MTYTNPLATIASIGIQSTPIPTIQMTSSAPTTRANGGALQAGDEWWEPVTNIQYIWLTDSTPSRWQAVGGAGFVTGLVSDNPSIVPYTLPVATDSVLGGVKVGSNLTISNEVLSVNPNLNPIQTINVTGTATLHTIVTGADVTSKVAVNANAGIIQTKYISLTTNPTTDTSNSEYGVSLRATGEIIGQWANLTVNPTTDESNSNYNVSLRCTGKIITVEENVSIISGARQGVVYKLVAGDGLTFDGQASTHIGGTVGNDYNTNVGTIKLNTTVVRTTDTQTITGDLVVAKGALANPSRLGTVSNTQNKLTENYADSTAAGTPTLGTLAVIDGVLCFGDGTNWKIITLGGNV